MRGELLLQTGCKLGENIDGIYLQSVQDLCSYRQSFLYHFRLNWQLNLVKDAIRDKQQNQLATRDKQQNQLATRDKQQKEFATCSKLRNEFATRDKQQNEFALICVMQNVSCCQLHVAKICCVEIHQATFFALSCVQRIFFALVCIAQKIVADFCNARKYHACGCCQRKFFAWQRPLACREALSCEQFSRTASTGEQNFTAGMCRKMTSVSSNNSFDWTASRSKGWRQWSDL